MSLEAEFDPNLEENTLMINYTQDCFKKIQNNGRTFVVTGDACGKVSGGPIRNLTYSFLQFHMHWGRNDSEGSEHLIDGKPYAAEV